MTTTITVKTHDWEVLALPFDAKNDIPQLEFAIKVPANSERVFHIYQGLDMRFIELPIETNANKPVDIET